MQLQQGSDREDIRFHARRVWLSYRNIKFEAIVSWNEAWNPVQPSDLYTWRR